MEKQSLYPFKENESIYFISYMGWQENPFCQPISGKIISIPKEISGISPSCNVSLDNGETRFVKLKYCFYNISDAKKALRNILEIELQQHEKKRKELEKIIDHLKHDISLTLN